MDRDALNAVVDELPELHREGARRSRRPARPRRTPRTRRPRSGTSRSRQKAEADYQRRLETIHAQGKGARDWVDKIYRQDPARAYRKRQRRPDAALLAAGQPITDPAQSDVAPVYMAEVDEANQQAVLELLAMVPASTEGTEPQLLRYTATGWVNDPKILRQLKSSAPPAIVSLDEATFNDTLEQVKTFYTTPEGKAEAEAEAKAGRSPRSPRRLIWGEYGELIGRGHPRHRRHPQRHRRRRAAQAVLDHRHRRHGQDPLEHPRRHDPVHAPPDASTCPRRACPRATAPSCTTR